RGRIIPARRGRAGKPAERRARGARRALRAHGRSDDRAARPGRRLTRPTSLHRDLRRAKLGSQEIAMATNTRATSVAALTLRPDRAARDAFLTAHRETLYRALTKDFTGFLRVAEFVYAAAREVPGLVPTREQVARESLLAQRDKDGVEIDQGILLSHVFDHPAAGAHLCHAMLLARQESLELLPRFQQDGRLDL